ncbi:MAG: AAA family ATPase [Bacilli bacterium]|nr:AAA family ATPase [Bacilli bacterium]
MPEKYFATVMKKTPVGENDYVYVVDSITAGDIDEETHMLVTTNGNKYKRIDDFSDFDENTLYYTNIIEVDRIVEIYNHQYDFSDAIHEYEKRCKDIVYYVTKGPNGGFIMLPIDKRPYINAMEKVQNDPDAYEEGVNPVPKEETIEEDEEDAYIESLKDLVARIIEGKFSPDELIDIKYRLLEQKEELEAAIESVDIHREALEEELDKITGRKPEKATPPAPTPLKNQSNSQIELIDVNDVFNKVTKVLIAQDQPARRMIVELSRLDRMRKKDYGILLTGQSGAGKTLMMQLIGRYLNRPVLYIDSTQLTAAGFVGQSIEQKLWELYEDCGRDLKQAERAIVFFDEIDKKGSEKKSDISGQAVLNMLLKFLDGTKYTACKNQQHQTADTSVRIDTTNMLIVGGGAFLDVYEEKKSTPCGFVASTAEKKKEQTEPTMTEFIEKAMMPKEFMGRVPVIIHLNNLNIDSLRKILLESEDSALKLQEEVFAEEGVKLTTKDGYIVAIASKALEEKIGARGLNKLITDSTWQAYDEVISNPGEYDEVILTEETVENGKSFQLIKKTNKKSS